MEIRPTKPEELEQILKLYAQARDFMQKQGNPTQWRNTEPKREQVLRDIAEGHSYVCREGAELLGVFSFEPAADDPTYHEIREGAWPESESYGVLHRIAVAQPGRGVAGFCLDWCGLQCEQLRVDTHKDNLPMQRAMEKNGLRRCGIITTYDGTDRLAYARPGRVWLSQDAAKRRKLLATSFGLYGLAVLTALGLLADLIRLTGGRWLLLLPVFLIMALPGCLLIAPRLRKGGGIGLDAQGIENRLVEPALHGSYAWEDFSGVEPGPRERSVELLPRDPEEFFHRLPRRTRKALRQKRVRSDTLPLSCLLLTPQDKKRLLRLLRTGISLHLKTK